MRGSRQGLDNTGFFVAIPGIIWQLLFLWVPLFFIGYLSFVKSSSVSLLQLSLKHYIAVIDRFHFLVIMRSIGVAFLVAVICGIIAYPVAYFIALKISNRWKNLCLFLLTLPFWINFLLQVYAWFFILEHNGLINTLLLKVGVISSPLNMMNNTFSIVLVMVHGYLPFMILPIYSVVEKFNIKLIEASYDLGANSWYTFRNITFPLTISGIKTGFVLIFVMTFGEFTIPVLVGGGKKLFVGTLISEYFFIARNMAQGAAFMCFSGAVLCLFLFVFYKIFDLWDRGEG